MEIRDLVFVQNVEGRDKPIYKNCGIVMFKDDGKVSVKIDMLPTHGFQGWLQVFEKREKPAPKQVDETTDIEPF